MLRLVSDGILQTTDRNAIVVPVRREAEIREIFQIRRTLEGDLAEAAVDNMRPPDLDLLRETQADFILALQKHDYRDALRLNARLRFTIYGAAGMPIRLKLVEGLWLRIGPTLRNMYPLLDTHQEGGSPHDAILTSIASRDGLRLRKAVIADLDRSESALLEYMRRTSEAQSIVAQQGTNR